MKKTSLLCAVCMLVLIAVSGVAQERGGGTLDPGFMSLLRFLELDEAQGAALRNRQLENAQELRPLAQALQDNQLALQNAVRSDSPDEATVGRLVLESRNIQREVESVRQRQREEAPAALNLSREQQQKLELLETALRVAPLASLAVALNLVAGSPALLGRGVIIDTFGPPVATGRPGEPRSDRQDGMTDGTMGTSPEALEMLLEEIQTEVDRIGQNVDRVSSRLSVPPIPRAQQ